MISILIPTMNRPENIKRIYKSAMATADPDNIEFVIYIDEDDRSYDGIEFKRLRKVIGPRIVLSEMWNKCYEVATGPIFMHCGDDIIFRTQGWDKIVEETFESFPDNIVFVFGNDGSPHNGSFGTHGFIHKDWVDAVGYFVPPYFSSDFNDTWLNDVARMIGRHQHIPILTEHMHPDLDKGPLDITHKERIERHQKDNVGEIYTNKLPERQADADKLKAVMK
jgi:glycosyltransferase involved in cell wall biosynthesis